MNLRIAAVNLAPSPIDAACLFKQVELGPLLVVYAVYI